MCKIVRSSVSSYEILLLLGLCVVLLETIRWLWCVLQEMTIHYLKLLSMLLYTILPCYDMEDMMHIFGSYSQKCVMVNARYWVYNKLGKLL